MEERQIVVDPNILDYLITVIEKYSVQQKESFSSYLSKMRALSYEWDDPRGYGEMMKHIEMISKNNQEAFEQIRNVYRKYYYDLAMDIRMRQNNSKV